MSQSGLTLIPVAPSLAAMTRMPNPAATNTSPIVNFAGLDGSRFPSRTQSHANTGASSTMKIGSADWNQLAGNPTPNSRLSVLRSAKRLRVEPACSNTDQKMAAARKRTRIVISRFRSPLVHPRAPRSPAKKSTVTATRPTPKAFPSPSGVTWMIPSRPATVMPAASATRPTTPFRRRRRLRACSAGSSGTTGFMPASPRYFQPERYCRMPKSIPTAAAPKPRRLRPKPERVEDPAEPGALREPAADERRHQRAEIDADIEDREAGVPASVLGAVQLADHGAHVRLEQPGAEDDEAEAQVEAAQTGDGEADVAEHDQHPAVQGRATLAEETVGEPAARKRRHVDQRRVGAVDHAGLGGVECEPADRERRRHEQDEDGPHPVVAEPLPELGEEERRQPAGMAEEAGVGGGADGLGAGRGGGGGQAIAPQVRWFFRMSSSTIRSILPSIRTRTS